MEGEVVCLAFVVPPEGHAVLDEVGQVLRVPIPDARVGEIQAPLLRIAAGVVRRPRPRGLGRLEDPAAGARLVQKARVSQARFADAANADIHALELGELLGRLVEGRGIVAEILVEGLAGRCVGVVGLVREPLEVADDAVDGVSVPPELADDVLDVLPALPTPAGGHEAEGVERGYPRRADEPVVGLRAMPERLCWQEVHVEVAPPDPYHFPVLRPVLERQLLRVCLVDDPEGPIAVGGVVVRRVRAAVDDDRCRLFRGQADAVIGAGAPAVQDTFSRAQHHSGRAGVDGLAFHNEAP
mmetsp:Transcript_109409/g.315118  ORF Transcript_109409/g.315118 Transcript_109409/m.315118 type:complete len:298 (+) Transcript_109409:401-1294(+)